MKDPVLNQVTKEANATGAQVLIAWSIAKGFITLPKSARESRIKENLEAVDVTLTAEPFRKLDALDEYHWTSPWDPVAEDPI